MCKYQVIDERPRSEWIALINEWVHDARDREMLERNLLDGSSLEEIAEKFSLSTVRAQFRVSRARKQLFAHVKTMEKQ